MACPEAPEILFMDRGTAQLTNGEVYVPHRPRPQLQPLCG
jgi:hypothetical protein